ncbi:hypothetical protein Pth03_15600 [Planotetraspora thailandica]|uniref:DUF3103 domain-containing protein n=1 Tax=Planotetraspora thailandica TaxID=487172 RepID=A0A8J3UYD1_9ACTN|nr:DUF3103 family protein [Planotetraspora thailandica]GII53171.1 hypothetical protein Pth03_15600 [Planotetraspora thailandica]
MTRILMAALASVTALALTTGTAAAATPPSGSKAAAPAASSDEVFAVTDRLARQIAGALADRHVLDRTVSATASGPADLVTLERDTALGGSTRAANAAVLAAKGLPATGGSLLRVRLADPTMRAALARGEVPLVAAVPSDDEPAAVTAYDPSGGRVRLDPVKPPARPVLVVDVDVAKALPMGLQVMRDTLASQGITEARPSATTQSFATAQAGGYWATKVTAVRLNDDKEPWIKGAAEIYSVVGGFRLDGKPAVDIVQMPYLDNDGTTYYPNQLLVHFSAYKYNLADVVMMEDDGDTNYQALAQSIAGALLTIVDYGAYVPLVNAIISAIPTSWWTDDPDYVDSWYTLSTSSSGRLNGAAGNGWMDVTPYWVSEL